MSIGYGAIGEAAIGESVDLAGADIAVPAASLALTATAPAVLGGALVDATASGFALTVPAPVLQAGALIDVPIAVLVVAGRDPAEVTHSATVDVPAAATEAFSAPSPAVAGGASLDATGVVRIDDAGGIGDGAIGEFSIGEGQPATQVLPQVPRLALMAAVPFVASGVLIDAPAASLAVLGVAPADITHSATVDVPAQAFALIARTPEVAGGASVMPAPAALAFGAHVPALQSGSTIDVASASLPFVAHIPEIDGRRRRVAVRAIAS